MAGLSKDGSGWRVQFTDPDGKRRTLRAGKVPKGAAEHIQRRVEALIACKRSGVAWAPDLADWLGKIDDTLHSRLVRVNLVTKRTKTTTLTLSEFMDMFFEGVTAKPATVVRMGQARTLIERYFSKTRMARTITENDATDWRAWLVGEGYAVATISRTVRYARQIWAWGVKREMVSSNVFSEVKTGPQHNADRAVYVEWSDVQRVIETAPSAQWRLLIALSRLGGLRVPSEAISLRWRDVDWSHSRLVVRSPKTEHHEGKGARVVPLFDELRPYLMDVFEQADPGTEHVITEYRTGQNLNPHLRRLIRRAGLKEWPRTWHAMRASRQSDLAMKYPLHTVCAWLGNTRAIAAGHYLQVTDADWQRATSGGVDVKSDVELTQKPAMQPSAREGTPVTARGEVIVNGGFRHEDAEECTTMHKDEWAEADLNRRHRHFQCRALPTELPAR